jgi:hypothetical protein
MTYIIPHHVRKDREENHIVEGVFRIWKPHLRSQDFSLRVVRIISHVEKLEFEAQIASERFSAKLDTQPRDVESRIGPVRCYERLEAGSQSPCSTPYIQNTTRRP